MKKISYPFKVLWAYWYFLVFSFFFILFYPLFFLWLRNEKNYAKANRLRRVWAGLIFIFTGIIWSVHSKYKLNKNQSYILCPNHFSYMDIPLVVFCTRGNYSFFAKIELKSIPLFNIFFRTVDIPVNRNNHTESVKALNSAAISLDKNRHVIMFPEGKIANNPPQLIHFKNGPFRLAIEKQVPVVPVTLLDNWKLLYVDGKMWGRPGIARAVVHRPISTKGMTLDDVDLLKEKVYAIIDKTLKRYGSK